MPTYEYKREDGTTFEIWQGINDEPLEKCPDTGQKVKRLISGGGGVVYKGEGFYVNDYKKNKQTSSTSSSSGESEKTGSVSDSNNGSSNKTNNSANES